MIMEPMDEEKLARLVADATVKAMMAARPPWTATAQKAMMNITYTMVGALGAVIIGYFAQRVVDKAEAAELSSKEAKVVAQAALDAQTAYQAGIAVTVSELRGEMQGVKAVQAASSEMLVTLNAKVKAGGNVKPTVDELDASRAELRGKEDKAIYRSQEQLKLTEPR